MLGSNCRRRCKPPAACSNSSGIVRLNVGGRDYVTSESTLQKVPESMLAVMISGRVPSAMVNGAYFIDRDPDLFAYVLEYLRTAAVELPSSEDTLHRLEREADFFMLPGMQHQIRSKLLEVCLEVKLYTEPFNCSAEKCNCGDGGFANLDAFNDVEIDAMDASFHDELTHPAMHCRLSFGAPFATVCVNLKTQVPRDDDEARIVIGMGSRARSTMQDILMQSAEQFAMNFGDCGCNGVYKTDGVFNDHTKYKNAKGAIIYFADGQWRVNNEDSTEAFVFFTDSAMTTPPSGKWASDGGGACYVEGADYPRPEKTSMMEALLAIRGAMVEGKICFQDLDKITEELGYVLKDFVEQPETRFRVLYKKVNSYNVGDAYWKKDQRRHWGDMVKLEFGVQRASQCKRRRVDGSDLA